MTIALACMPNPDPPGWTGGRGGDRAGGSNSAGSGGASGGAGGSSSTGGSSGGTGGSTSGGTGGSSGGASSTGGRGGSTGGSGGSTGGAGGSSTGGTGGSGGTRDAATMESAASAAAWPGCLEPVFSGVTPTDFCMVYEKVCTFTGMNRYASRADCMTKFRGGSNDGDACKSGHLCRATLKPDTKEMDCRTSGTAACRN